MQSPNNQLPKAFCFGQIADGSTALHAWEVLLDIRAIESNSSKTSPCG